MSRADDPVEAVRAAKETTALLREARVVLRRIDKLTAAATNAEIATTRYVVEAKGAVERLVQHLARHERTLRRRAQEAVHRRR
jgi:hypothetical protein